ncbi:MAG: phosphoribosylformylglycinamidine cyclo-ligase [Candidatus Woykebacteria bacterium RBG_16_44_10]|uniref:Phosphoribosylformylglycinamidine cyclo-ligase n=1 Tax=Candidatus Woykebacteria bacterium RBG_16_44_10 TaxID=1802597 RepID=A0A1G1WEU4_9BACT|nr:MAG: phosphoribosylformylglycinamidine cyclo-ligase [Candidatus Woykebacteria bacterium RBG_16_44_10]
MRELTYEDSGVSLTRGDVASQDALRLTQQTFDETVTVDFGLPVIELIKVLQLPGRPLLHATMDGVGTKLMYAAACDAHDTVGIDLVAMCVDDHSRYNIRPICFAVYRGTNTIDENVFSLVTRGVVEGCKQAGVPYIAGETAEMPGFYSDSHYELVGVSVGVYEEGTIRRGQNTLPGDLLVALPSLGGGSNGFSLIRRFFPPEEVAAGKSLVSREEVLNPTPIYTRLVLEANRTYETIRGWAHITGGGLGERGKLASLLPEDLCARLDRKSWQVPPLFKKIQEVGGISDETMFSTFNMGLMMIAPVQKRSAAKVARFFESLGIPAAIVGRIEERRGVDKVEII